VADEARKVKAFVYVVNLSRVYWGRKSNRADRAVRRLREFVRRHVKGVDRVVIGNDVNERIWERSREKPPRRVKILVEVYEEGGEGEERVRTARVSLAPEDAKPGPVPVEGESK